MLKRGLLLATACLLSAGCFGPNYARIDNELRAKNLQLQQELDKQKQQQTDLRATISLLTQQLDAKTPRVANLPEERLQQLFTVDHVVIEKSTDAWDTDNDGKPDGFRVFIRPYTKDGTILPATGQLKIEAFDLALQEGSQRVGEWNFTPEMLQNKWFSGFGLDHFALNCPWKKPPAHSDITFKIHFVDALTGHAFEDQQLIKLHVAAPTASRAAGG